MTTLDQLMGQGQSTGSSQPLRPTTLAGQRKQRMDEYQFAQYRLREQEDFIQQVGLPDNTRVSGAPAVYDTQEREEEYALKKLRFMQSQQSKRFTMGYPLS